MDRVNKRAASGRSALNPPASDPASSWRTARRNGPPALRRAIKDRTGASVLRGSQLARRPPRTDGAFASSRRERCALETPVWIAAVVVSLLILPATTLAGWKLDRATAIARIAWHHPCVDRMRVVWRDRDDFPDPTWAGRAGPDCTAIINRSRGRLRFEEFCNLVLHEAGHLAGFRDPTNVDDPFHSSNLNSVMASPRLVVHDVAIVHGRRIERWIGVDARCLDRGRLYLEAHGALLGLTAVARWRAVVSRAPRPRRPGVAVMAASNDIDPMRPPARTGERSAFREIFGLAAHRDAGRGVLERSAHGPPAAQQRLAAPGHGAIPARRGAAAPSTMWDPPMAGDGPGWNAGSMSRAEVAEAR
jgi:hypothetical protein